MTHQKSRYESDAAFLSRCRIAAQDISYRINARGGYEIFFDDRAVRRMRDKGKAAQMQRRYCNVAFVHLVARQPQRIAQMESAAATPASLERLVVEGRLEMHAQRRYARLLLGLARADHNDVATLRLGVRHQVHEFARSQVGFAQVFR